MLSNACLSIVLANILGAHATGVLKASHAKPVHTLVAVLSAVHLIPFSAISFTNFS